MTASALAACPSCGSRALARVREDPPWCTRCEWNLDQWRPPMVKEGRRGARRRRVILTGRARAFRFNRALYDAHSANRPGRPRATRSRTVLTVAAVLLLVLDLALIAGGGDLLVAGRDFRFHLLGLLLLLIGIECRVRFPRIENTGGRVEGDEAPALFALIEQACSALGAPRVDVLRLGHDFNAFTGRSGVRRRVVLNLGLPLWASLTPAGRQALLGHELGHLVNGDPTKNFAAQPALTTFARLANVFDPQTRGGGRNLAEYVGAWLAGVLFLPVHLACRWCHRLLIRLANPDRQLAEIHADALSVRLAGTAGAVEVLTVSLRADRTQDAIRDAARATADVGAWRAAVAVAVRAPDSVARVDEQASLRYDAEPMASHPPLGLRLRLVRAWPATEPELAVPVDLHASADEQLHRRYERWRRTLG